MLRDYKGNEKNKNKLEEVIGSVFNRLPSDTGRGQLLFL